ncbi:ribonuclease HI, partial [Klebsiella pneumoniae]|nr:ribonuclease HI [Klebsiella pneumoniae]
MFTRTCARTREGKKKIVAARDSGAKMTTKTPARQHTGCRTKSKARYQTHQQSRT